MDLRLIATCPEETKDVLVRELEALGAQGIEPLYRAVAFTASERVYYEAHLKLRSASRILRVLREMPAHTPEMLYSQARRIPWYDYFDVKRPYLIDSVQADRGPEFMTSNEIGKRVREALQDVFYRHQGEVPKVDLKEPKVVIVAFCHKGRAVISLDTAGKTLHKRGYRLEGHPAPIKETLAAALLEMVGYDGTQAFLDPMCGSGTIAIEAAMIALGKAPLIHRKKGEFLLEWLADFDKDLWRDVQEEARQLKRETPPAPIVASDINGNFVELARKNALRARVERYLSFDVKPFQEVTPPSETGLLLTNMPYGERLEGGEEQLKTLYREIGDTLKQRFSGWRCCLLVNAASPYKFIGLRPTRRIPILNGSIACKLLVFDIYAGSRKAKHLEGEQAEETAEPASQA